MEYNEVLPFLQSHNRVRVDFTEYRMNKNGQKAKYLELEDFIVQTYIGENAFIPEDEFYQIYDEEVEYQSLCRYPYLRLVVKESEVGRYYVLHLNKAAFTMGLQEITLTPYYENEGVIQPWSNMM